MNPRARHRARRGRNFSSLFAHRIINKKMTCPQASRPSPKRSFFVTPKNDSGSYCLEQRTAMSHAAESVPHERLNFHLAEPSDGSALMCSLWRVAKSTRVKVFGREEGVQGEEENFLKKVFLLPLQVQRTLPLQVQRFPPQSTLSTIQAPPRRMSMRAQLPVISLETAYCFLRESLAFLRGYLPPLTETPLTVRSAARMEK